ncbi:avidin/streptavidin family protein [Vibrio sp. Of7-15]|uniref:avidin/streptavidin family protein n=1 Tax=Vibrio sp. Of7-15 TaxID=2724879 RepID=UPI001EF2B138|nr:avidin/streptavidin family protein [Vibrio sp. Of7-15]MCG7499202.1 avidin/streptavidin family protein [Vibrio sp. Of7-15]
MNTCLSGIWTNSFGSKMSLIVDGTQIIGTYSSHTGSTGEYRLIGHCSKLSPSEQLGQSIAISIYWKNIHDGVKDESWHWSGTMCGQLQLDGTMTLTNAIVVSVAFEHYQKGNYIDELVFSKNGQLSQPEMDAIHQHFTLKEPTLPSYPLVGKWQNNTLTLDINQPHPISGYTQAHLITPGIELTLSGFIDVDAHKNMAQSLSLSGYNPITEETISMSGMLDYSSHHLTLYSWSAQPTSPEDSFMQTQMRALQFEKSG